MKNFIGILVLFTLLSCSDFLDIEPREDVSVNQQFSTLEGTLQALNGAYVQTQAVVGSNGFLYADLQGGNISFSPVQSGTSINSIIAPVSILNSYNFNENAIESPFNSYYIDSYRALANINNIVKFTPDNADISAEIKKQILAEAVALRAFIHYNLLQFFAQNYSFSPNASHNGIVYANRILQGGVDFESRQTVAECYVLIKNDLDFALENFTENQAMPGPNYSYFNPISTKAFYARVALQSQDYAKAVEMASNVVNTSGISLMPSSTYIAEWEKPNLPVSEVILEFTAPLDSQEGNVSSTVAGFYNAFLNTSTVNRFCASLDLIALFGAEDIRKNNFVSVDYNYNSVNGLQNRAFYFPKKFQDNAGTLSIRLSEMHLILAESFARLNQLESAKTHLNSVRNRANLASITENSNLLDEIYLERRRELCFEGFLFFDNARFNKGVNRNLDCISLVCNLNYPSPKFVLPIPQSTVDINQNMIQNESY